MNSYNALYNMLSSRYGNKLHDPMQSYGMRSDGTEKGPGYFGSLNNKMGGFSTELSGTFDRDGKQFDIPFLVPTLDDEEISHLLSGGSPTRSIIEKAIAHAKDRESRGMSAYFMPIDKVYPYGGPE